MWHPVVHQNFVPVPQQLGPVCCAFQYPPVPPPVPVHFGAKHSAIYAMKDQPTTLGKDSKEKHIEQYENTQKITSQQYPVAQMTRSVPLQSSKVTASVCNSFSNMIRALVTSSLPQEHEIENLESSLKTPQMVDDANYYCITLRLTSYFQQFSSHESEIIPILSTTLCHLKTFSADPVSRQRCHQMISWFGVDNVIYILVFLVQAYLMDRAVRLGNWGKSLGVGVLRKRSNVRRCARNLLRMLDYRVGVHPFLYVGMKSLLLAETRYTSGCLCIKNDVESVLLRL